MKTFSGRLTELNLYLNNAGAGGWLALPPDSPGSAPKPGQYLLAHRPDAPDEPLATPVFLGSGPARSEAGFWLAAPLPSSWQPGSELALRGPLGHGFRLPAGLRRLALLAWDSPARLLPLAERALKEGADVALYCDADLPGPPALPALIEAAPRRSYQDALNWADLLALDVPPEALAELDLEPGRRLPCPVQALISLPMPCGGLADCGACAVLLRRGWKLACVDGPVFEL